MNRHSVYDETKFEIRSTKLETNSNVQKGMTQTELAAI
jgi:hypothetical protein